MTLLSNLSYIESVTTCDQSQVTIMVQEFNTAHIIEGKNKLRVRRYSPLSLPLAGASARKSINPHY